MIFAEVCLEWLKATEAEKAAREELYAAQNKAAEAGSEVHEVRHRLATFVPKEGEKKAASIDGTFIVVEHRSGWGKEWDAEVHVVPNAAIEEEKSSP